MKKLALFIIPVALLAAEPQKKATPAPAPAAGPVTVPADAKEIAPHVYRATDAQGKTWIYRQTPFGLSKVEDRSGSAPVASASKSVEVKATDLGDSVRFERPMPMGSRVWTVKKAELSAEEKSWLEQSARKTAEK